MPTKLADLSENSLRKLKALRFDWLVGKHEGPRYWEDMLEFHMPEFLDIEGESVLLPLSTKHFDNLTVLRCIKSVDGNVLTLFLKDTTYTEEEADDWVDAGFLAVCERPEDEAFFVASVYHEWYIMENFQVANS